MKRGLTVLKIFRYRRRLEGLSFRGRTGYVLNVLLGELIRRGGPAGVRHFRWLGPRMIELSVTERCQCRCRHCYAGATEVAHRGEMSKLEIFAAIDQAASLHTPEICFTGGEALLRADLPDIVAHARSAGIQPKLITNGILLSTPIIRQLKEAGLSWCAVSIDSPDPEAHDDHRCYPGCFERALAGLAEAIRLGIPGAIQTCARKETVRDGSLERVVALGSRIGVEAVRFTFPVVMGRYDGADGQMLSQEERERVRSLLKDPIVTIDLPAERSYCEAGITKMAIAANGDVTPCAVIPLVFGNVRREPLRDIWRTMAGFQAIPKSRGQCPMSDASFRSRLALKERERSRQAPAVGAE